MVVWVGSSPTRGFVVKLGENIMNRTDEEIKERILTLVECVNMCQDNIRISELSNRSGDVLLWNSNLIYWQKELANYIKIADSKKNIRDD